MPKIAPKETEYRKSTVTTTRWRRADRILIDVPADGHPSVRFHEQDVVVDGDGNVSVVGGGGMTIEYNPDRVITRYNARMEPNGKTATYKELLDLVNDAFLSEANSRDAAVIAAEAMAAQQRIDDAAAEAAELARREAARIASEEAALSVKSEPEQPTP